LTEQDNDYKKLLVLYNILQSDNQEKKNAGIHDYSLMNALLKKTDEVNLHSNFIYSMINPASAHYYGPEFLKLFLAAINIENFINLDNAKVHKEVGKIDLLIEDGNNVIIIENKLRAVDQPSQINRYILYTIENYLGDDTKLLSDNVHIIYLSQYKSEPSPESKSIEGFTLDNGFLTWKSNSKNTVGLALDIGTKIKFTRVKHSDELNTWIEKSKEYLANKPNSEGLIYAFNEYGLILKRLDTKKGWRNLMSLDEYTIALGNDEQKMMYEFMIESKKVLASFRGKKLYRVLEQQFLNDNSCVSINSKKEFSEATCIQWFQKKGNDYKEVGFEFIRNKEKYIFELATKYIYFGKGNRHNPKNVIGERYEDIFKIIDRIK